MKRYIIHLTICCSFLIVFTLISCTTPTTEDKETVVEEDIVAEEEEGGIFYLPDEEYIELFRRTRDDLHSDGLILHLRNTLRHLYENPDLKFEYVLVQKQNSLK